MRNKTGRAKPVTPKAGVTKTSRRYACVLIVPLWN